MSIEISLQSLTIGYSNKKIIENINAISHSNKMIGLIGRNGQGKSTLLKTIAGLLTPISGNIDINGQDINTLSEKEKSKIISVLLTKNTEINHTSVEEFISYGRYPYTNWLGINSIQDQMEINKAIEFCGLEDFKSRIYSELSDGEKQKVNIARAIAQNTPIILLDEPTAHLDLVNKIEVLKLLKSLVEQQNKTIIISTHQIELALQLCNEIWLLNKHSLSINSPEKITETKAFNDLFDEKLITYNKHSKSFNIH